MKRLTKAVDNLLNITIALCLAFMSIFVFGNVVLRYGFNSGITWSEEMARFLFIWLTFLGAIVALKDNEHLGVEMFVKKLPPKLRKLAYVICNLLILYCLWLVLNGSWKMTLLNANSPAPATGISLSFVYGIGIIMSVWMGLILLFNLYKALFHKTDGEQLVMVKDSEEL
ncbi:TRAP transporter small permease [Geobacillus stearothermophilus]|nr:TRAP transporter small permease [Geobacillus stearothermophilus]